MLDTSLTASRILIIDDQSSNVLLLEGILEEEDYNAYRSITDSRQALPVFLEYRPDLILLDLQMPYMDGFEVMHQLQACVPSSISLPILVLTADITPETKRQALAEGATDFLTKPFDPTEVILRIKNLLRTRALHLQLQDQNQLLEQKVRERTAELEETQVEILERLALAAEYRDDDTGEHTRRVGRTSAQIAQALGLPEAQVELIRRAAPLHDVGKIHEEYAPLLRKEGKLDPTEKALMQTHSARSAELVSTISSFKGTITDAVRYHHENYDGSGYPDGLAGRAIPIGSRIIMIADTIDAMTTDRPYRKRRSIEDVIEDFRQNTGKQFDPRVVSAFCRALLNELQGPAADRRITRLLGKGYLDSERAAPLLQQLIAEIDPDRKTSAVGAA